MTGGGGGEKKDFRERFMWEGDLRIEGESIVFLNNSNWSRENLRGAGGRRA